MLSLRFAARVGEALANCQAFMVRGRLEAIAWVLVLGDFGVDTGGARGGGRQAEGRERDGILLFQMGAVRRWHLVV